MMSPPALIKTASSDDGLEATRFPVNKHLLDWRINDCVMMKMYKKTHKKHSLYYLYIENQ